MATHQNKKLILINALATLGYLCCLLQWLWAVILFLPLIMQSGFVQRFLVEPPPQPTTAPTGSGEPSVIFLVIGAIVTVIILVIIVYILAKLPAAVGHTGRTLTRDTATKFIVPAVTHRQKLPAKKAFRLTLVTSFILKGILVIVPFGLAAGTYFVARPLGYGIVMTVAAWLLGLTAGLFALQLGLVAITKAKADAVW